MKIILTKGQVASQNAISTLQQKLGESLPLEFLDFIAHNDGAEPEPNVFEVGIQNESGVSAFIPAKRITDEMVRIENLPSRSFPVAWTEGGNYIFINQASGGAVFFWDHEHPENLVKLAGSFRLFLDMLKPFKIASIKLKPEQVKKAWIDPDFLKGLQD